jgi:hypothetical protein
MITTGNSTLGLVDGHQAHGVCRLVDLPFTFAAAIASNSST